MATKEKEAPVKEVAKNGTEKAVAVNLKGISRDEAVKALKSLKKGEEISGYLNFEPGDSKNVLFLEWTEIQAFGKPKGEMTKAVKLLTDSGKEQINADAVVISQFEKISEGSAVNITCMGEKTNEKGTFKTFKFFELNQ